MKEINLLKWSKNNANLYNCACSACQLGITVTSFRLGWLGEPTFEKLLHPIFEAINLPTALTTTISFAVSFIIVTYLHVVLGELAPNL